MTTVITKNSSTASAVPATGDLVQGELAVNVTDKKIFTKNASGTVVKLVGSLGNQEASAVAITGGTVAGVAQTNGTLNNTPIGGTTASTVTGTLITATTGFSGPLTGAVTGNTAGTHTGDVVGNVTGNLTGNVTASSGSSSFNNVTINGTLDMNASSSATIINLTAPTNSGDAATKGYVDTSISNLVASAPTTLDTLNEIAAALGNDPNLSTTLTTSIATKLPLAGGTMTGNIAMGTNKVTGLGTPTAGTDAATKTYVDTADNLKLNLSGGTLTGNLDVGANKVTSSATPSTGNDLTNKTYVDGILGSATSAATSAASASTSATNAANSASSASTSATNAQSYLNTFKGQYYGSLSADPTLDPLGAAIGTGDLYWNSTANEMRVYNGSAWVATYLPASNYLALSGGTLTGNLVLKSYTETVYALGTSGSIALNPANGTIQTCAAAATVTFTDSLSAGQSIVLMLTNGSTYTINWPTITWVGPNGNTAPTLNAANTIVFWKVSTTLYGAVVGKYA